MIFPRHLGPRRRSHWRKTSNPKPTKGKVTRSVGQDSFSATFSALKPLVRIFCGAQEDRHLLQGFHSPLFLQQINRITLEFKSICGFCFCFVVLFVSFYSWFGKAAASIRCKMQSSIFRKCVQTSADVGDVKRHGFFYVPRYKVGKKSKLSNLTGS